MSLHFLFVYFSIFKKIKVMRVSTAIYWLLCGVILFLLDNYSVLTTTQLFFVAIVLTTAQLVSNVLEKDDY